MLTHFVLSLILILNLPVTSQKPAESGSSSKPDFSGYWNALILKSDRDRIITLKISYRDPKLEITRMVTSRESTIVMGQLMGTRNSNRFVYYTDGRGETQKGPTLSGESTKSKTERIGNKFVITSLSRSKEPAGKGASDHTATLEVSSDGKILTETTTLLSEGTRRIVNRYDRRAGDNTTDINGEWVERSSNRLISLTIVHREPEIKVTRREVTETQDESEVFVHYTDGRGETNMVGNRPVKSVTKWKEKTLVFALSSKSKIAGDTVEIRQTVKLQFAEDGDRLVEVRQASGSSSGGVLIPPGPRTLIFARSATPIHE
jgi:hypothetical protein